MDFFTENKPTKDEHINIIYIKISKGKYFMRYFISYTEKQQAYEISRKIFTFRNLNIKLYILI